MSNFDRVEIGEYLAEWEGIETAISVLEDRQNTIDDILRNEYNFQIGKDRFINVGGGEQNRPMKKYVVNYYATYWVEAEDEDEAIDLAIEQHEDMPDGTWEVVDTIEE